MSESEKDKRTFEALGYIPEKAPKKPVPPQGGSGTGTVEADEPEEEDLEVHPLNLRMAEEDFEPEFGPEASRRTGEQARERFLASLPSGPIKVLKILFVDQIKDEYDRAGNYLGSTFPPNYVAVSSWDITVPCLTYTKIKDGAVCGVPWGRIAHWEVIEWSKSKPE